MISFLHVYPFLEVTKSRMRWVSPFSSVCCPCIMDLNESQSAFSPMPSLDLLSAMRVFAKRSHQARFSSLSAME